MGRSDLDGCISMIRHDFCDHHRYRAQTVPPAPTQATSSPDQLPIAMPASESGPRRAGDGVMVGDAPARRPEAGLPEAQETSVLAGSLLDLQDAVAPRCRTPDQACLAQLRAFTVSNTSGFFVRRSGGLKWYPNNISCYKPRCPITIFDNDCHLPAASFETERA